MFNSDAPVDLQTRGGAQVLASTLHVGRLNTRMIADSFLDKPGAHAAHRDLGFEFTERVVYFRRALHDAWQSFSVNNGDSRMADRKCVPVRADEAPPRNKPSLYPEPFGSMMAGRAKRSLGDLFGVRSFGVNHVTLRPGAMSALHHRHSVQDEFVLVLSGEITLVHDEGETLLTAGMCVGFPHGGIAHHLLNASNLDVTYLEIGDRLPGDSVSYPRDDLAAVFSDGGWCFTHKDGRPY